MFNHKDDPYHLVGAISNATEPPKPRSLTLGSRAMKEFNSYSEDFFIGQKDLINRRGK
jgi:hypothetical protein